MSLSIKCLSMILSVWITDKETKLDKIASLIKSCSVWISKLEDQAKGLEPEFQETADEIFRM